MARYTSHSKRFWLIVLFGWAALAPVAHAAPAWVARGTNLARGDWSFDPGFGLRYSDYGTDQVAGTGLNLEFAVGVLDNLQLGMRSGVRFGTYGQSLRADQSGRMFDRQTFGTVNDTVANPELNMRGRLVHGRVMELALEARAYLPVERYSRFGLMFGVPLLFHLGRVARIDTGLYLPVLFYNRTQIAVSCPIDLWLQATSRLWLGLLSGVRYYSHFDTRPDETDVSLGFALGYQASSAIDLKTMLLFPGINHNEGARHLGVGFGLEFRVE